MAVLLVVVVVMMMVVVVINGDCDYDGDDDGYGFVGDNGGSVC